MKHIKFIVTFVTVFAVFYSCSKNEGEDPITPDVGYVVYGNIYTAENNAKSAEAFAVRNGKFEYVGDMDGVQKYVGADTKIYDYRDKGLILPGMCDAHAHYLIDAAFDILQKHGKAIRFAEKTSYNDYLNGIKNFYDSHPDAKRIFAVGYGTANLERERTAADLDAISTDIPIMTFGSDLHDCCVNTFLLKKAGIMAEDGSVSEKYKNFNGGSVLVDKNGKPTGILSEQLASYVFINYFGLEYTDEEVVETILYARDKLHSRGVVSVLDGWTNFFGNDKFYEKVSSLDKNSNDLKINMTLCYSIASWHDSDYEAETAVAISHKNTFTGPHLRHNVKLFIDGIVETGKGYILGNYIEDIGIGEGHGKPNWTEEKASKIVSLANGLNEGVHCHVMGDAAARLAINAFMNSPYHNEVRNSMCHLRNVAKEDYAKIITCNGGCAAGFNWHSMDTWGQIFSFILLPYPYNVESYPMASFFEAGISVAHSSDCPCDAGTFLPFECMEIAVTGQDYKATEPSYPWWPSELLTTDQALQSMTINGAWMLSIDNERGSIKSGKYADFIVIDNNVRTCALNQIHDTNVLATFFEGECVYEKL